MRSSGKPLGSRTAVSRSRGFAHSLGDDGDLCFREIPAEAPAFELARVGLQRPPRARPDPHVVLPLALLRGLVAEGDIGGRVTQRAVLGSALQQSALPHPAGTIVGLGFRWGKDDPPERRLRQEAH